MKREVENDFLSADCSFIAFDRGDLISGTEPARQLISQRGQLVDGRPHRVLRGLGDLPELIDRRDDLIAVIQVVGL